MTSSTFTPEQVSSYFITAEKDMPRISTGTEKPSFTSLQLFQDKLDENMLAVPNPTDGLGYLGLVITATEYATLSGGPAFDIPADPGLAPPLVSSYSNRTAAERATFSFRVQEGIRNFQEEKQTYTKFIATKALARKHIVNSVDNKFINHLRHARTAYQNVDPITILTHLWTTYGGLDEADMSANEQRMRTTWNPPTPIEAMYEQLETGQKFATRAGETIAETQLVRWAYEIVDKTGLFERPCETWRNKALVDRTWVTFKTFFTQAENDRGKRTAKDMGYANAMSKEELDTTITTRVHNEIARLMSADAAYRNQQQHLPSTEQVPSHDESRAPANEQIQQEANQALTTQSVKRMIEEAMQDAPYKNTRNTKRQKLTVSNKCKIISDKIEEHVPQGYCNGKPCTYCYTHGICFNLEHNSATCKRCNDTHKKDATLRNKKGGCEDVFQPRQRK